MKKSFFGLFLVFIASIVIGSSTVHGASEFSQGLQNKLKGSITLYVGNSKAFVDGNKLLVDNTNDSVSPVIVDGKTLVPVRFISESLNAKVTWDEASQATVIRMNSKSAKFVIGSKNVYINGTQKQIDVPAQIINDRTFIPLRILVEALGKKVFWDDSGIIIISDKEEILNSQKDRVYIDEIKNKFRSTAKLISIPEHGDYILDVPNSWNFKMVSSDKNWTEAEITPKGSQSFIFHWAFKDGHESLTQLKQDIQDFFDEEIADVSVEKSIELKELTGENIQGYYFTATGKELIDEKYKFATTAFAKLDENTLILAMFEGKEKNSQDEINFLKVVQQIKKIEKQDEIKDFKSQDGSIQVSASSDWREEDGLVDDAEISLTNPKKDINLAVMQEKKTEFADDTTLSYYAGLIKKSMLGKIENPRYTEESSSNINNLTVKIFSIKGEVDKVKAIYVIAAIESDDYFYQIVGWTLQIKYDQNKDELMKIITSFKENTSNIQKNTSNHNIAKVSYK